MPSVRHRYWRAGDQADHHGPVPNLLVLLCPTPLSSTCHKTRFVPTVPQEACRIPETFMGFQALMLGASCAQVLMTRPRDEWRQDVSGRYKVLEHFSKEDARLQFLRILRSLPYGALYLPKAILKLPVIATTPAVSSMASQNTRNMHCMVLNIDLKS